MFCGSVLRFHYAVGTKHSTFRCAMEVSYNTVTFLAATLICSLSTLNYFSFWTACSQGIMDTLAKFDIAVLVDVFHCLCVYRYFSRLLFENKSFNILEQKAFLCSLKFLSFSYDLTLPIVGSTFQLTGRHDLIRSSRSVEIFAASPSSSTSGSKAWYFLFFKLHHPTSGESGRQQQLTTRLSSFILDMCSLVKAAR